MPATDRASGARYPADDPGWSSYGETILVVHGNPSFEVPLSQPITAEVREAFAAVGLVGAFGLVTPDNPFGRPTALDENERRRTAFAHELAAREPTPLRVDGLSPDRKHREVGVALAWPQSEVLEVARRWDQSAIYWFDGEHMWVIGACTEAEPWRLAPQ